MAVIYEKKNHIGYITLNNPEKANILDKQTSNELSEIWKEVWEDSDVRVAILTAVGDRHFCAGHNSHSSHQQANVGRITIRPYAPI